VTTADNFAFFILFNGTNVLALGRCNKPSGRSLAEVEVKYTRIEQIFLKIKAALAFSSILKIAVPVAGARNLDGVMSDIG
jgi:hypothetical protein